MFVVWTTPPLSLYFFYTTELLRVWDFGQRPYGGNLAVLGFDPVTFRITVCQYVMPLCNFEQRVLMSCPKPWNCSSPCCCGSVKPKNCKPVESWWPTDFVKFAVEQIKGSVVPTDHSNQCPPFVLSALSFVSLRHRRGEVSETFFSCISHGVTWPLSPSKWKKSARQEFCCEQWDHVSRVSIAWFRG